MAKDGTNRGGARPGTGPKKKALVDKINEGKAKGSMVISPSLPQPTELTGDDVPAVRDYMKKKQKDGSTLCAEEVFRAC